MDESVYIRVQPVVRKQPPVREFFAADAASGSVGVVLDTVTPVTEHDRLSALMALLPPLTDTVVGRIKRGEDVFVGGSLEHPGAAAAESASELVAEIKLAEEAAAVTATFDETLRHLNKALVDLEELSFIFRGMQSHKNFDVNLIAPRHLKDNAALSVLRKDKFVEEAVVRLREAAEKASRSHERRCTLLRLLEPLRELFGIERIRAGPDDTASYAIRLSLHLREKEFGRLDALLYANRHGEICCHVRGPGIPAIDPRQAMFGIIPQKSDVYRIIDVRSADELISFLRDAQLRYVAKAAIRTFYVESLMAPPGVVTCLHLTDEEMEVLVAPGLSVHISLGASAADCAPSHFDFPYVEVRALGRDRQEDVSISRLVAFFLRSKVLDNLQQSHDLRLDPTIRSMDLAKRPRNDFLAAMLRFLRHRLVVQRLQQRVEHRSQAADATVAMVLPEDTFAVENADSWTYQSVCTVQSSAAVMNVPLTIEGTDRFRMSLPNDEGEWRTMELQDAGMVELLIERYVRGRPPR